MEKKGFRDIPIGGLITKAGSAEDYNTGSWRTFKPVRDEEKCIHCLICWVYCPDSSILVSEGKNVGFDYKHCKGCGICAKVCPKKCIQMVKE
ncbi:MAG: 4Fe-4S binding protein [Candidatus Omnitrophica bacterium]|nr:4Fe-4S binding protein [Candidatus Omnitrophota bacterium]